MPERPLFERRIERCERYLSLPRYRRLIHDLTGWVFL